jgi:hypothetical protein
MPYDIQKCPIDEDGKRKPDSQGPVSLSILELAAPKISVRMDQVTSWNERV